MNSNGFKLRTKTEASEYQKRIDQIDSVILCLAEAERLVANLGKSLLRDIPATAQKTVDAKISKKPAWEGIECFRIEKRGYTYMVGTFAHGDKEARFSRPRQKG